MKVISVFQTADGKQFTDRDDAKKHEAELEAMDALRKILSTSINSDLVRKGNIDNVLRHILLEAADVCSALQTHKKKTPKTVAA
jgi:hypothetical protein